MRSPSHVYVMSASDGLVKIGLSRKLDYRLKAISKPDRPVTLEWATARHPDSLTVEMTAHTLLQKHHVSGEWFNASVEDAIIAICSAITIAGNGDKSHRRRIRYHRRPSNQTKKTISFGFSLPSEALAALKAAAKNDTRTVSGMTHKIVTDWLKSNGHLSA